MNVLLSFAVVFLVLQVGSTSAKRQIHTGWEIYKIDRNRTYLVNCPFEEEQRFRNYIRNIRAYLKHSDEEPNLTFEWDANTFMDKSFEDWSKSIFEVPVDTPNTVEKFTLKPTNRNKAPKSFDWRKKGIVHDVREQGVCTASYAMAVLSAVEMHRLIRSGDQLSFSPQEIIDCVNDAGCNGGSVWQSFDYILNRKNLSIGYDYLQKPGPGCWIETASGSVEHGVKKVYQSSSSDEELLKKVISTVGPVVTTMDINHESFMRYGKGIYYEPKCTQASNHAVVIIGYGSDNGKDFWIIENSMSSDWGEGGFMRIARNRNNHCGIGAKYWLPHLE